MRSQAEIEEAMNMALDQMDAGASKWPSMSYEQGVEAALGWALGNNEAHPMKDE